VKRRLLDVHPDDRTVAQAIDVSHLTIGHELSVQ
jgi:hypothetical protein